jgi:hypothetical protein
MTLRHYPKINGAPMAQTNLRHHWKFPRAGDGAKPRAITPSRNGAAVAQDPSRASGITRYAPAALCLRRRSQAHRYQQAERLFTHDQSLAVDIRPGQHGGGGLHPRLTCHGKNVR